MSAASEAEAAHERECFRIGGPVTLDHGLCPECGWRYKAPVYVAAWLPTAGTARPPDGARCVVSRTNEDGEHFDFAVWCAVHGKWDISTAQMYPRTLYLPFDAHDHFYALPERE